MHVLKICAALAAATISFGALDIAAAQIESSPAFRETPRKKKTVRKAPPAAAAPAAAVPAAAPATPAETTQAAPAESPAAQAAAAPAVAGVSSHATHPQKRAPYPPAKENCRNTESFEAWKARFRKEAAARGVSRQSIAVVDGTPLATNIIGRDRKQGAIFVMSFLDFQTKLATPNRVQSSKRKVAEHRATFERAKAEFGVPASVITGFWALESDFGAGMGKLPILPSLVALAYDCRRSEMFTEELIAALQIIDRGDMQPNEMIGSWAGEIGQTQFLPKDWAVVGVDGDGDGRVDLRGSAADAIGSVASFLSKHGWQPGAPVQLKPALSGEAWRAYAGGSVDPKHPLSALREAGVQLAEAPSLPEDTRAALIDLGSELRVGLRNFYVITRYNRSALYAAAVADLAEALRAAPQSPGR